MQSLDRRNKTIRIAFDLIVYFRLEQHHKVWRFCISWIFIQKKDAFGLGMTSMVNTGVSKRSVNFQTCCGSFSALFQILHIAIASISFAKSEISASEIKTIFRKSLHRETAKLHQTLCILPETSTSIIEKLTD